MFCDFRKGIDFLNVLTSGTGRLGWVCGIDRGGDRCAQGSGGET